MSIVFPGLGTGLCSAGLTYDPRFIVTAAHCVSDQAAAPNPVPVPGIQVTVRVGSLDRTAGGVVATGVRTYLYPDWMWGLPTGLPIADLALVELDRPVPAPPMLVASQLPAVGDPTRLIGWGLTQFPPAPGTALPTRLQEKDTVRVADTACAGGWIGAAEVCLGAGGCFGDSGGPALTRAVNPAYGRAWFAVALNSREGDGAAPCNKPSIYTDLTYAPFRAWIHDTISHRQVRPCTCPAVRPDASSQARTDAFKLRLTAS